MNGLIGKKVGMTQVFEESGARVPVTVIELGPCRVLQVKTPEKDGYSAAQIGFGDKITKKGKPKAVREPQPMQGHLKKSGAPPQKVIKEFRLEEGDEINVGDTLTADVFEGVEFVDVTATSKGRGFQGVVKRHNFRGGRKTHGGHMHRRGGSIGQCVSPARVMKGRKMPGHMGHKTITTQNLKVVAIRPEENVLLVRGAVPGPNGGSVCVRKALKKK